MRILGWGSALPLKTITNADLEKIVDTSDEWIVQRTGIRERRRAAPDQSSSDLATEAARMAVADAGIAPEEIGLVIVCTATPDQAQEVHALIRTRLRERFGDAAADSVRIQYGGSVKPDNAAELFGQTDIDGGLIGGASLTADDFADIVRAAA